MPERFTLYAWNPLTRSRVTEITQFSTLQVSDGLYGGGDGRLTVPWWGDPQLHAILPSVSGLALDDAGTLRWTGWVRTREMAPDDGTIQFGAKSWFDYYNRRKIRSRDGMPHAKVLDVGPYDVVFENVDQFHIVADLLGHAAQIAGPANLGLTVRFHTNGTLGLPSGVTRTRTYFGYERKSIAQAIDDLAVQTGGFDYTVSSEWDTSVEPWIPNLYLDLWYPRKGDPAGLFVLEHGANVRLFRLVDDGEDQGNPVTVVGAGTGDAALTVEAVEPTLLYPSPTTGIYPYMEKDVQYRDEGAEFSGNLTRLSNAELAIGARPLRTASLTLTEQPSPFGTHIGDVITGDTLRTIANFAGFSVDEYLRVVQQTYTLNASGLDRWVVDVATDDATLRTLS